MLFFHRQITGATVSFCCDKVRAHDGGHTEIRSSWCCALELLKWHITKILYLEANRFGGPESRFNFILWVERLTHYLHSFYINVYKGDSKWMVQDQNQFGPGAYLFHCAGYLTTVRSGAASKSFNHGLCSSYGTRNFITVFTRAHHWHLS